MKICFISPYPPRLGGLSTYSKRLVDSLSQESNLDVSVIPFNSFKNVINIFNIKTIKPDIVRLEYNIPAYGIASIPIFFIFVYFRLFSKIKFIVNYHEVKRETDLLEIIGKVYYYFFSKLFDKIYVHTAEAKRILNLKCRVDKTKIKIIPHGAYEFKNKKDFSKELTKKYELKNKKIILYFGYIHIDKGIQYLLKASEILFRQNPKLRNNTIVLISGAVRPREGIFKLYEKKDQTYLRNLVNLKNELNLNDFIKFTGHTEDKYVYSLLKLAKVIVLPYTNVEQSGVLNLALAVHKPVIASNIGGLKETLYKAGILVPPENAQEIANSIMKLLQDKKHYANVVRQYKELNYLQSTNNITDKLINEYKNLIET